MKTKVEYPCKKNEVRTIYNNILTRILWRIRNSPNNQSLQLQFKVIRNEKKYIISRL